MKTPIPDEPELNRWAADMLAALTPDATVKTRVGAVRAITRRAKLASPHDITEDDITRYYRERRVGSTTRRVYLNAIKAYAAWAKIPNPGANIKVGRPPKRRPNPIRDERLHALLAAASPEQRAQILLGSHQGFRAMETAKVAGEDVWTDGAEPQLRVIGKNGSDEVLPLHPLVWQALRPFVERAGDGPLWPHMVGGESVSLMYRRLTRLLGYRNERYHKLRHFYGTKIQIHGGDIRLTQVLMRHDSSSSTEGYVEVAEGRRKKAVESLPDVSAAFGPVGTPEADQTPPHAPAGPSSPSDGPLPPVLPPSPPAPAVAPPPPPQAPFLPPSPGPLFLPPVFPPTGTFPTDPKE
ncbi:tyrosine-type recombinase/integrase [Streptacidiphilus cavernicola]|uniref:Tyrosine-type recombinase/integrase n=1 Tax=Streptacidiphilus cavernicola TaxID=3342716 RepID=A0ABV6VY38_9ACTN